MSAEKKHWQPLPDTLPVVSVLHKLTASYVEGSEGTLTISVTTPLPEGELLLLAASRPHSHYWYTTPGRDEKGHLTVELTDFSEAAASTDDVTWALSLGKKTDGGINLYPLEKGGKASYVKNRNAYFCDDRRRYLAPAAHFTQNETPYSILPCYNRSKYVLTLLVTPSAARYARQVSCRLTNVVEVGDSLRLTVLCPKTLEQPEGVCFRSTHGAPSLYKGSSEDFSENHTFTAEVPLSALDELDCSAELVCALEQAEGDVLYCPIRFADRHAAADFQARWEFRSPRPNRYLSVGIEHTVTLDVLPEPPGTQHPGCSSLQEYLLSPQCHPESGVTALSEGGTDWQWRLRFPNLDLSGAEEVTLVMEKAASVTRAYCSATVEPLEHGALVTADLSALPDTLENTLYSDWLLALAFRRGDCFYYLPVLDPLHTYYDPHDFQTNFNFTADRNRRPIGTISLFGRTVEGCPHWVRKYNTRMCFRMADHTLRYMTSFTCRAEWGKLHFGVLRLKVQCPKIDGVWNGCVLAHRAKQESDRKDYEFPLVSLTDCGEYYEAMVKIHVRKLNFFPLYWDLRMTFEQNGTKFWCSVKAPMPPSTRAEKKKEERRQLFFGESVVLNRDYQLFLYRTAYNRFSLVCQERSPYTGFFFRLKERLAFRIYQKRKKQLQKQAILLIYEKYCCMAQDNGFYFFQYCMEHNMEQELNRKIYFVIDKKSNDYKERLLPYQDHVIPFMSLKHMVYLLGCRLMVSSDSKSHAYAWRCKESIILPFVEQYRKLVFLQHGVIALKKVDFFRSGTNVVDLFVTSNDRERDIIINELGYRPHEVIVTGLTRWDVMEDCSAQQSPKTILIMPTWRNWLEEVSDETFRQSDYYQNYMALLNSPRLEAYLKKHNLRLNFYIHPKFREYIGSFSISGDRVRLIPFGAEPLNQLMMECSMLITDYSSVCWDVYHQGKPVLFYQFDTAKYNETQGAYIDLETELFGDRATDPETLFSLMEEAAEHNFQLKPKYAEMRPKMFKYLDKNNSQRVIDEIRKRNW